MVLLAQRERAKWDAGKASGAVYSNDEELSSTVTEAYRLFSRSNPLHPDLWPSGLKFEAEVCVRLGFVLLFIFLFRCVVRCIFACAVYPWVWAREIWVVGDFYDSGGTAACLMLRTTSEPCSQTW